MASAPGRDFTIFRGWTGDALLRPWFDQVAHGAITGWFLPLSRAWAAGLAARGSTDAFAAALGTRAGTWSRAGTVLARLDAARRRYEEACADWEAAFFGEERRAHELAACEAARADAARRLMTMRGGFLPLRRSVPSVAWEIADPATVERTHGVRLSCMARAWPPPPPSPVERSRILIRTARRESWVRLPSPAPAAGDTAWARVLEPARGPVRGVVISLHGILMEQEMWRIADPISDLVAQGFCVVRPEGPWHGRRRIDGTYGGEPILARGVLGFIELFEAWLAECAAWIGWVRREAGGPVALAGISLGALTAQQVVSVCNGWPASTRPDAAMLITTTGDMVDGTLRGSFARALSIPRRLTEAGWTRADIQRWRVLVEPGAAPAIDPARIVMVLGDRDTVTPYQGGRELAARWDIPAENLFVRHGGHFSAALDIYRDPRPLDRLTRIVAGL